MVNIEPGIAITQNFVPRGQLESAIRFLRDKPEQVSGFKTGVTNPHALFVDRLKDEYPDLAVATQMPHKRKWNEVVGNSEDIDGERRGFGFGFEEDIEDEIALSASAESV